MPWHINKQSEEEIWESKVTLEILHNGEFPKKESAAVEFVAIKQSEEFLRNTRVHRFMDIHKFAVLLWKF